MTRVLKIVTLLGFFALQSHAQENVPRNPNVFNPTEYCILSATPIITEAHRTDICRTSWIMTGSQTFKLKKFESTEPEIFLVETGRFSDFCIEDKSDTGSLKEAVVQFITKQVITLGLDKLNPCTPANN